MMMIQNLIQSLMNDDEEMVYNQGRGKSLDCSKAKKKEEDWTNTRGAMGHFITPGFICN